MNKQIVAHLCASLAIIFWGLTFVASKLLLDVGASPFEILLLRFSFAWIFLTILCPKGLAFKGFNRQSFKQELPFAICGFFGTSLYFLAENTALCYTLTSHVGVISSTAPFLTGLLFWVWYKQKPTRWFFVGFVCAFLGLVLVATNGKLSLEELFLLGENPLLGDFLVLLAAGTWAVYCLGMREIERLGLGSLNPLAMTKRIFFWGLVSIFMLCPAMGFDISWFSFSPTTIGSLLFLALFGSSLCYVIWNYAISVLGEVKTSLYIYCIPVVTLVASYFVLGERIAALAYLGIVCILLGLFISGKS